MADKAIVAPDPLILTILSILAERPSHPYEIQRLIRERHKDFAFVPPRSLYHAVERLQQAGLIEPIETSREGKRPERTIYRITAEGNEDLVTWLTQLLSTPKQEYPAFMVALSLLGNLSADIVTRALLTRSALLEGETAGINATLRALAGQLPRLVLLEMEYTLAIRQAELNWVRMILEDLRAGKVTWQLDAFPPELFKRSGSEAA
ncbi:MAG: PadR family transcriptional regulator [Caldilineaceae bacterium]